MGTHERLQTMAQFQSPDTKKEEFRRYLERSGVIDALTKVLVGLYEEPERPANALDFIKMTLGAPTGVDVEALKAENEQLRKKNEEMAAKIEEMSKKVSSLHTSKFCGLGRAFVCAGASAANCGLLHAQGRWATRSALVGGTPIWLTLCLFAAALCAHTHPPAP